MNQVDRSRLKPVDTSGWNDRAKLFVDLFGGWNGAVYSSWVQRQADTYRQARGMRQYAPIRDHDDFTNWLALEGAE